ncbi:unnamed protein product, partial [Mesorhabditis spiculigera]
MSPTRISLFWGNCRWRCGESDIVLQANTKVPKVLDSLIKGLHTDVDRVRFISYRRVSAQDEGNGDDQKHVPVAKLQIGDVLFDRLKVPLWITSAVYEGDTSNEYAMKEVDCRCFVPPNHMRVLSLVMPRLADNEQQEWRVELHKMFNLSSSLPCLRSMQSLNFTANSGFLRNPHLAIKNYKPAGRISAVKGSYDYYHYKQQGIDDNGWGCAYRSLQTIWNAVGIDCSYIAQFNDISEKARELQVHFDTVGSPVMIGGNMLAHTILGVDFDDTTGECRFLVLDPHYVGVDDVHVVTNKGWCAWKFPSFWKNGVDAGGQPINYNIVKPQLPANII